MSYTNLGEILEHAQMRLPGVLADNMKLELGVLLNDFCDGTNVWLFATKFTTVPGQAEYGFDIKDGMINRLMNVTGDDNRAMPAVFSMPQTVTLLHVPTSEKELTANFALLPDTYSDLELPDWILAQFKNGLLDGLIGRMMSQTAKPYSNEKGAVFHLRNYNRMKAQAKNEILHQFTFRGQGWAFPQSSRTRNQRGWIW